MATKSIKVVMRQVGTSWSAGTEYKLLDYIVVDGLTMYVCRKVDESTNVNKGHALTDTEWWDVCTDLASVKTSLSENVSEAVSAAEAATANAKTATSGAEKVDVSVSGQNVVVTDRTGASTTISTTNVTDVQEDGVSVVSKGIASVTGAAKVWANVLATQDTTLLVDGEAITAAAHRTMELKNFKSVEVKSNPKYITRFNISFTRFAELTKFKMYYGGEGAMMPVLDMSGFDTSGVTDMSEWFRGCQKVETLDVASWDVSNVTNMELLFYDCRALTSLDVSNWNVANVKNMNTIFCNCFVLQSLDLSSWDLSSCESMTRPFGNCLLTTLKLGEGFGKMKDSVGSVDFTPLTKWTDTSVNTLRDLYDRASNGLGTITLQLSSQTKAALGDTNIAKITAKGYVVS